MDDPTMTTPNDENHPLGPEEEHLLNELAGILGGTVGGMVGGTVGEVDPVPADVVAAARSSFAWHDIDAGLASLVADSAVDSPLVLTRGPVGGGPRMLSFAAAGEGDDAGVDIEIEVVVAGDGSRRIRGMVVPGRAGRLLVRQQQGEFEVDVDADGRFAVGSVVAGPVCLRYIPAGDGPALPTETDWFAA